jgi:sulfotransferase family protein
MRPRWPNRHDPWHEDRLLWIFGSSRSGSTWLLRMFSELDGVVSIDDPHLGHHLGVWRPIPLAWAASAEPPELRTLLDAKRKEDGYFFADRYRESWWGPLRELIRARFEAQAAELPPTDAPTYVVKEPGSHVAMLLTELFPKSKLIFLLRDGRDVVDSWLAAYRDGSWAIPGGAFPVAPWGRLPLIRWLSSVWVYRTREVWCAYDGRDAGERVLIRYEELRDRTVETLERAATLLDFEVDPEGLEQIADRHAFERVPAEKSGSLEAIRLASPGSWKDNLSAEEQLAMHEVMGETLAEFGYEDELPVIAARA